MNNPLKTLVMGAILVFIGYTLIELHSLNNELKAQLEQKEKELTMYKALVKQYRKEVTFNKIAK